MHCRTCLSTCYPLPKLLSHFWYSIQQHPILGINFMSEYFRLLYKDVTSWVVYMQQIFFRVLETGKSKIMAPVDMVVYVLIWVKKSESQECQHRKAEDGCLSSSRESKLAPPSPFCSIWTLQIDCTHLHPSALLSSPVQVVIFFRNAFTDTSRNNVLLAMWASLTLSS